MNVLADKIQANLHRDCAVVIVQREVWYKAHLWAAPPGCSFGVIVGKLRLLVLSCLYLLSHFGFWVRIYKRLPLL